jgi:phospholipid/cholesterol/gamma-HCH transport system substrate-binding protein
MGREIRLGIFFFAALIVLGFVTVTVSQWTPPWAKRHVYVVYFPSADGLKRGDQVRIVGVPYGRVDQVKYNRGRKQVEVTTSLDHPVDLREDYAVTIQESALIGGRYIEIFPGTDKRNPLDPNQLQDLRGSSLPSPMQEISKMVVENRENVRETLQDVREVARTIREGPGTLHELIANRGLYDKVEKAVDHLEKFGEKLNSGQGSAAKLISDPGLYDDLRTVAADLKAATAQVREGPGLVHDLLYDPEISKDLKAAVEDIRGAAASVREILEKVQTGEKPLLAYAVDEQTYGKAEQAIQDAAKVIGRVARIEVSLGGGSIWYPDSGETVGSLFLRLQPGEDKYFRVGIDFLSLDPKGDVDFKEKLLYGDSDALLKINGQLAYRLDFLADWLKPFWLRGGMIEGKPGGAIDAEWKEIDWLLGADLRLTWEMRDAYGSVEKEKLDEQIHGPMMRAYATARIWKGFKAYLGASRLGTGNSPEVMGGLSYEFTDDDLRSVIALIGLAN